jgi:ABC-2 type transport system ATP-binding protein
VIVRCENLDQSYGAHRVLTSVTVSVESGCTGLLGPNGAGKSTLIKSLLAQLPIPRDRIQIAGIDPASDPLRVRQLVGYMPEADVYLPGMNGLELCSFCGQLSGMKRVDAVSRAHEVLNFVGLGEARYREVDGYSTGMRQRLKLASALVHGPRLLLLDEPTSGLDPAGREEILNLIDDVSHARGIDVLVSSHILRDIEQTCDRVVLLNEGRVLFAGSREEFQHQESRTLHVRVKSGKHKMIEALRAKGCREVSREGMGHLEVELPQDGTPQTIWMAAQEQGLQIRHLAPATVSLDRAFEKAVAGQVPGSRQETR